MDFITKPSWLKDYHSLHDIANFNLYMPQEVAGLTSLQDPSAFYGGIKQFLYWKGQLLPSLQDNMVFLAFLGPKGLKPPNVLNVTTALQDICDISQICEYYQGANTNFVALSFNTKEPVQLILSKFLFFDDSVVLAVTHNSTPIHRFKLLWLPPLFDTSRVHHLLNQHTKSHRLKKESIGIAGGAYTPTNVISGTLTLEPGGDINLLPHLIQLPSPHKGCALLTIESRAPLCLKCRTIGHTRKKCTMIKCQACSKVHFPNSPCGSSSYSSVAAKNITPSTEEDWLARLSEDCDQIDNASSLIRSPTVIPTDNITSQEHPPTSVLGVISADHSLHGMDEAKTGKCNLASQISTSVDAFSASKSLSSDISPKKIHKPSLCEPTLGDVHTSLKLRSTDDPSTSISTPVATFTRRKASSKVHITTHDDLSLSSARSHLISYSTPSNASASLDPTHPFSTDPSTVNALFGDPEPETFLSSDSDSSSINPMLCDSSDSLAPKSSSRKRKGSASSTDESKVGYSLHNSPSSLPIVSDPLQPSEADLSDCSVLFEDAPSPITSTHSTVFKSDLHAQIGNILSIDPDQVSFLEDLCLNGSITPELIKIIKLLSTHGIGYCQIIGSPHILRLRFVELKRKLRFLADQLGVVTIHDICGHGRIESKVFAGSSVSPSGIFHD